MDKTKTTTFAARNAIQIAYSLLAIFAFWGLLITLGWASPAEFSLDDRTDQPTKSIESAASDVRDSVAANSEPQDFFNDSISPLSKATQDQQPQTGSDVSVIAVTGPGRECSTTGDSSQSTETCITRNTDNSFSESTTNIETFGDEKKEQTVIRYFTPNGESEGEDTIRIKTNYVEKVDGSKQEKRKFYDIIKQPATGLITRDIIVTENDKKGQLSKATWASYTESGPRKARLDHHAVLYYEGGKITSGFANKYNKSGKVVDTLLNYDPKNTNLRMEKTGILKWAGWIDQLIHTTSAARI